MKAIAIAILLLLFASPAHGLTLHVYWDWDGKYTDGTPVDFPLTEGWFNLYASHTSMVYFPPSYQKMGDLTKRDYYVELPPDTGVWYFVMTAASNYGIESDFSNEIHINASTSIIKEPANLTVQ